MNLDYETPKELFSKYAEAENKSEVLSEIEAHRMAWLKEAILFLNPQANIPDFFNLTNFINLFDILKIEYEAKQIKQSAGLV